MSIPTLHSADLFHELVFTTSRSSGSGGQNVNKVNTKVTLAWDVVHSAVLSGEQKELLLLQLGSKLTKPGVLMISSQDKRSQLENKENTIRKLDQLLAQAFTPRKIRKASRPTRASKLKRAADKMRRSEKKEWRRKL